MGPTTRAKAHSAADDGTDDAAAAGTKHELADKKDQKTAKKQKTLEETVENGNKKSTAKEEKKEEDAQPKSRSTKKEDGESKAKPTPKKSKPAPKEDEEDEKETKPASNGKSKDESSSNPSSSSSSTILEKGTIYFFLRGRVNVDSPSSVSEIARTYLLLRPSSTSTDLSPTTKGARLLAVPKKTFPRTGRERWISFVEKTDVSVSDLQSSFLEGNEYETKTRGTQHTPPVKPEGEGVYCLISRGRDSHLVYLLTRPKEDGLGEVQRKLGIKGRGSWVVSTRNPEYPPPGGDGRLPDAPEFGEEIKKDFHSLRWAPTKPSHLDVQGAQILLVGESSGIEKATEEKGDEGEDPKEELEELAEEDEKRMEALGGDDSEAIFKDLKASAEELPDMQTEF